MVHLDEGPLAYLEDLEARPNLGYSLLEPPILDSLSALARISNRENLLVKGGIGLSLHCYQKTNMCGRKTDDLDAISKIYFTKSEFTTKIGMEIILQLQQMGYQPELRDIHKAFGIRVLGQNDFQDAFFFCIPRTSKKYWDIYNKVTMEEFTNAIEMNVPERGDKVYVARIEDILAPKIQMTRPKDVLDLQTVKKHGVGIDMQYLEDALLRWSGGSEMIAAENMTKFQRIISEI